MNMPIPLVRFVAHGTDYSRLSPRAQFSSHGGRHFAALTTYPYREQARVMGAVESSSAGETTEVNLSADGLLRYTGVKKTDYRLPLRPASGCYLEHE